MKANTKTHKRAKELYVPTKDGNIDNQIKMEEEVTITDEKGVTHKEIVIANPSTKEYGKVSDYKLEKLIKLGINLNDLKLKKNEAVVEHLEQFAKGYLEKLEKIKTEEESRKINEIKEQVKKEMEVNNE